MSNTANYDLNHEALAAQLQERVKFGHFSVEVFKEIKCIKWEWREEPLEPFDRLRDRLFVKMQVVMGNSWSRVTVLEVQIQTNTEVPVVPIRIFFMASPAESFPNKPCEHCKFNKVTCQCRACMLLVCTGCRWHHECTGAMDDDLRETKLTADQLRAKRLTVEELRAADLSHLSDDDWKLVMQSCAVVNSTPIERVRTHHSTLRQTRTYVELDISDGAFREISVKLLKAGYGHVFIEKDLIDMQGIALKLEQKP